MPPIDVIRYDADDPYLVVAADKGTATFSDIANRISVDAGFWLGDAFASGGSAGYDHKAMGITARGAWESVKRHFREMGIDCQTTDFTCVGIGDMSGDVFGNGMLLSKHTKLVAAFDHRHVFVDPDPDPESQLGRAGADCSRCPGPAGPTTTPALISAGGGMFPRTAKSVTITEPMRAALGLAKTVEALSPAELITACLKAPVDLLWNGGIGTYVKAAAETNAEVGDKANDGLRVNGADVRAKCVGEGGNLGLTQLGPDRVRRLRRPDQHRLHRQLRRSGHLRLRGQHQDPAQRRGGGEPADAGGPGRAAGLDDRRGGRAGARQQLRPEPGPGQRGPRRRSRWPECTRTGWSGWRTRGCWTARSSSCPRTEAMEVAPDAATRA